MFRRYTVWTNAYLLRKNVATGILKGLVMIQLVIFGICFVLMFIFTFLPPIVLTGLVILFLTMAHSFPPKRPNRLLKNRIIVTLSEVEV